MPKSHANSTIGLDIDDECIKSSVPGFSEGKFYWSAITSFTQNDRVTMLYIDKRKFLFFPTSAMSSIQRTELNDLIARHVTKR
ncbi:MAG: YcxB family protein [Terracidiphilus sp.]